ncbi:clostripain [Hydrogenispora ethanolica]|uniref:Clostripain n=1 Tax=Hydrogenispora ethanolica TaxID=1082276 RepID=A0A4R1RTL8_HYDET|nr:clostripain-related cysteine peptidase [Hydrogenispora ethanolica]TCL69332.1 clostripain [Hydrogenispora ethanolica]
MKKSYGLVFLFVIMFTFSIILTGCGGGGGGNNGNGGGQTYTIALSSNPTEGGTIQKDPDASSYSSGTNVTLTAVGNTGWIFSGWSGDLTGITNPAIIQMNRNKAVVANFTKIKYTLTPNVDGQGTVSETLKSKGTYENGAIVTVKANPSPGWKFDHWTGDLSGDTNPADITMNKDKSITAHFIQEQASVKWNFLVYMDGDNNLEGEAIADLNEMEQIGSTNDVNVLVLLDRSPLYDATNGNWSGTRLYKVTKDNANSSNIVSTMDQDYGEKDMSNPNTLTDFIVYCQQKYPAQHTVLTLWDHGGGVYPRSVRNKNKITKSIGAKDLIKPGASAKGICWDDTTGSDAWSCLTTDEVAQALSQARAATGKKIDVLNFDACVMQMMEQAYEWRNEADYLVGSEESVPGTGNDYDVVLEHLTANPNMTSSFLTTTLVDDFYSYYSKTGENTTYSAINLGSIPSLLRSFSAFATALNNSNDLTNIGKAMAAADYYDYPENIDLYGFANAIPAYCMDTNVKNTAAALKTAISNTVLSHHETGTHAGSSYGVAILFPYSHNQYKAYFGTNQYTTLKLAMDTQWDEFLIKFINSLLGSQDSMKSQISWSSGDCDIAMVEPDGIIYDVTSGSTANGVFSADSTNGGTESYTLRAVHQIGNYWPALVRYSGSGTITLSLTINGVANTYSVNPPADGDYYTVSGVGPYALKSAQPQLVPIGKKALKKK